MKNSNRMISIELKFFVNDMNENNDIEPGHMWDQGTIHLLPNAQHGILERKVEHFHSLMDISGALERLIWDNGLKVHVGGRSINYVDKGVDSKEALENAKARRERKRLAAEGPKPVQNEISLDNRTPDSKVDIKEILREAYQRIQERHQGMK